MKKVSLDTKLTVGVTFLVAVGFVVNNLLGYFFIPKGAAYAALIAACGCCVTFVLKRK
jgi:hypothetical protein